MEWTCGFYSGCHPGQHASGSAATFEQAREAFETAWNQLLPTLTEGDFQPWRDQDAWTKEKYRRFDRGERMDPHWKEPRVG
ncbi:hypothetical protein H8A99_35900 [Bradyrhizobium sp. Arg68]|uniref:hypothetical protein n=1 Tax=Bradyrhizobium ivorense TaxID=2511166 RepID=UPI001E63EF09|nr:hypothetical protein [Bradyrhizobium ivorense]MCC8941670.1 hypothetical protein [Bradyrhizobium ivorense]